ncbi:MAG: nucleotidyltransferase family protein [Acidimicrobiia bacterium]
MTATAVAVLAAGRGSRVAGAGNTPKPLLELRGRPLVTWAVDAALASGLRPALLVVGHQGSKVGRVAPQGVSVVRASGWRSGIARSLRAALVALEGWAQVGAVCIGLADQPRIGSEAYRRLASAYDEGATLAVATYGGVRANPVLLARSLWADARNLGGDEGARVLMRTHPVVEVACDGTGHPDDIDTVEDLQAMEHTLEREMES